MTATETRSCNPFSGANQTMWRCAAWVRLHGGLPKRYMASLRVGEVSTAAGYRVHLIIEPFVEPIYLTRSLAHHP